MQARITVLRSCSGERHGGQLAARAPHGRGVAGRPRRPSENMTGPQTTNMSATPGKSQNHTEACVMQTVTHLAGASRCCLTTSAPLSPFHVYGSNFTTVPRTPAASPTPPRSEQLEMPYGGIAVTWCRPLPTELGRFVVLLEPWRAPARPKF